MSETIYHFDHTLTTEERFGIRKWLMSLQDSFTNGNQTIINEFLASTFTCTGFTSAKLNKVAFTLTMSGKERVVKKRTCVFSELTVTGNKTHITARGNYHETMNKELVLEGKVILKIYRCEEKFKLQMFNLYPRLIVH